MAGGVSGEQDFNRRAGTVWAAGALFVLALCLPAVRFDDGVPGQGTDLKFGSPTGWDAFVLIPLFVCLGTWPSWLFVAWMANPAFGLAAALLLAGRPRAAAVCGTLAVGLGVVSWVAVGSAQGTWLLAGYYFWQAAHLLVAVAAGRRAWPGRWPHFQRPEPSAPANPARHISVSREFRGGPGC